MFAGRKRKTKTNYRRSSSREVKDEDRRAKNFPFYRFHRGAVATRLALVGIFCHDAQPVLTFVKEEYRLPWHILLENDHVPRSLNVNGVSFGINAGYDTHDRRSSNRHRIAYLRWFSCHAASLSHAVFCGYPLLISRVVPC